MGAILYMRMPDSSIENPASEASAPDCREVISFLLADIPGRVRRMIKSLGLSGVIISLGVPLLFEAHTDREKKVEACSKAVEGAAKDVRALTSGRRGPGPNYTVYSSSRLHDSIRAMQLRCSEGLISPIGGMPKDLLLNRGRVEGFEGAYSYFCSSTSVRTTSSVLSPPAALGSVTQEP